MPFDGAVAPRYQRSCLSDILPSVCDGLRVPGAFDILGLGEADRVVVLVIDGLGQRQLQDHADIAPQLAAWSTRTITTVFPSTTPTALTSLGTGCGAGEHGIVGACFRLPETGALLWPLGWRQDPPATTVQPHPTWWERAAAAGVSVAAVSPRLYRDGGLTGSALRGAEYLGGDGPGERITVTAEAAAASGRTLTYAYWEALDRTAHIQGPASPHYRQELAAVESWVTDLAEALPAGTRLVITADHGIVEATEAVVVDDAQDRPLARDVVTIAGEPRMRQLYTRRGAAADVAATWGERLRGQAVAITRAEAVARGLFGPLAPEMAERIGDVIVLATGRTRLAAPTRDSIVSGLVGQHGSLTGDEMEIPLAVVNL